MKGPRPALRSTTHISVLAFYTLCVCPLAMSKERHYVWGQQSSRAHRKQPSLDGGSTEMLLKIFSLFLLPNSCSVEKPFCNHSYKRVSPFFGIGNNCFSSTSTVIFRLAFISYVVIHEFHTERPSVVLYYVSTCIYKYLS